MRSTKVTGHHEPLPWTGKRNPFRPETGSRPPAHGCLRAAVRKAPASSGALTPKRAEIDDQAAVGLSASVPFSRFIPGEPMKSATKTIGRVVVDLERRADLLQHAVIHDRDTVGHGHGLRADRA